MPSRIREPSMSSSEESSSSEDELPTINGAPSVKIIEISNNVKESAVEEESKEPEEPEDPYAPGMKTGLKNLYSGKEDKKGRYQWQEKIPEDLGEAAENDKTAKWALLVRNVKVYGDPTKVLAIHSIVVQSPLLKNLLAGVLKNYPGITVGLNRLEFSGKFEPLIHRWSELQAAIADLGDETEDERITKEHANLLQEILIKEFKSSIDTAQDMKNKRVMTYDYLWTLFQPGAMVFSRQDGQEMVMTLQEAKYGTDCKGNPCFWITCKYIDWDGTRFGTNKMNLSITQYSGTRHIAQLRALPLEYHPDAQALKERLIERGSKAEALAGPNYKAYHGIGWRLGAFGTKDQYNIKGRVCAMHLSKFFLR